MSLFALAAVVLLITAVLILIHVVAGTTGLGIILLVCAFACAVFSQHGGAFRL